MQRSINVNWWLFVVVVLLALMVLWGSALANVPVFLNSWGSHGTGYGQFNQPSGMAISSSGQLYVADSTNNRVQRFDAAGNFQMAWDTWWNGSTWDTFDYPFGVAVASSGQVYVTEAWSDQVSQFDGNGNWLRTWGSSGGGYGQFNGPQGVAVDGNGEVYVADEFNGLVQVFDAYSNHLRQWSVGGWPVGIAVGSSDQVYVSDVLNDGMLRFDAVGNLLGAWGGLGSGPGQFAYPQGVAAGAGGHVYVADTWNHRIQRFDAEGNWQTLWGGYGSGNGQFYGPGSVAVSGTGLVYVADTYNDRIQRFLDYESWVEPASHVVPDSITFDTNFTLDAGKILEVPDTTTILIGATLRLAGGTLRTDQLDLSGIGGTLRYEGGDLEFRMLTGGWLIFASGSVGYLPSGTTALPNALMMVESGATLVLDGGYVAADNVSTIEPGGVVYVNAGMLDRWVLNEGEIELGDPLLARLGGPVSNHGIVSGSGRIEGEIFNDVDGQIRVAAGQRLHVTDTTTTQYNAGRIDVIGSPGVGGVAEIEYDAELINWTMIAGRNALFRFNGGLTNYGALALSFGTSDVFGDVTNSVVGSTSGTIAVAGNSAVTFYDDVTNSGVLNVAAGSTAVFFGALSGNGNVGTGDVQALGDLLPGASPGVMAFGGDLTLGPLTNLEIELGGTGQGSEHDALAVAGELSLAGTLSVMPIDLGGRLFQPDEGDTFEILSAAGGITGGFADVFLPGLDGNLDWRVLRDANSLTLAVVAPGLLGDYNGNGIVDAADYTVWRDHLGQMFTLPNEDLLSTPGQVTPEDYAYWKAHFGETFPGSGAAADLSGSADAAVPEPTSVALSMMIVAGALLLAGPRAGRRSRRLGPGGWLRKRGQNSFSAADNAPISPHSAEK